jgi:DNA adenine methylase
MPLLAVPGALGNSVAEKFVNGQVRIAAVAERLRRVQIENADWQTICRQWDAPDTLTYLDPPYTRAERNAEGHRFEMKDPQHRDLLAWCKQAQGKVLLSGYDNALYAEQLVKQAGWVARPYGTVAHSSASRTKKKSASRTEILWLNPLAAAATPSLFCPPAAEPTPAL